MPGNRSSENGDFVTPRAAYREVTAADASGATDTDVPVLDTRRGEVSTTGQAPASYYGRNAQIDVAAIFGTGVTSATLQLWLLAEIERVEPQTPEELASSSSSSGVDDEWVQAGVDQAITGSALVVFKDIPPGQYKVLVSAFGGTGTLVLRTQYAA